MPRQIKPKNIRNIQNKFNTHETQVTLPDIKIRSPFLPFLTVKELCSLKNFPPHENKPGQSPNAFIIYKMELHRELKNENFTLSDFSKLVSKRWKSEPEYVKTAYRNLADAVKCEYRKKFPFVFLQDDKIRKHVTADPVDPDLNIVEVESPKLNLVNGVKVDHLNYYLNVAEVELLKLVNHTVQVAGAVKDLDYDFNVTEVGSTKLNAVAGAVKVDCMNHRYDFNVAEVESAKISLVNNTIQMGKDIKITDVYTSIACQAGKNHKPYTIEEFYTPMYDMSSSNPFAHFSYSDFHTPPFDYSFNDYDFYNDTLFFWGNPSYSPESSHCCYPLPHKNSFNP
ncbi:17635_t:CDS:1 [Racocetra persica]|uniref:17635_t:CDS:1 n=1 Tax=Racocetra persica TaxID=160502 RepID=A0ACA9LS99_9GLOM|nr:17635_t:CDS:1 [Racocetra persica]